MSKQMKKRKFGYPVVPVKGQSFKKVKEVTLPDQSMSLREILKRFIRKESLPVNQQGIYEDRAGDLEKLGNQDIFDQMEIANEIKNNIAREKSKLDQADAEKVAADKAAADEAYRQRVIAEYEKSKQGDPLTKK